MTGFCTRMAIDQAPSRVNSRVVFDCSVWRTHATKPSASFMRCTLPEGPFGRSVTKRK